MLHQETLSSLLEYTVFFMKETASQFSADPLYILPTLNHPMLYWEFTSCFLSQGQLLDLCPLPGFPWPFLYCVPYLHHREVEETHDTTHKHIHFIFGPTSDEESVIDACGSQFSPLLSGPPQNNPCLYLIYVPVTALQDFYCFYELGTFLGIP